MQSINRRQVAVRKSLTEEADDGGYMPGAAEERLLEVWELTLEAWALFREADAERALQRDVAVLIR